ncbi:unnamed protein product [marine sediment metagenome]|uniref:Uncharacterized protein n=1 Tax=marine sediment metagenome TaxID=412755 RepID=X1TDE6_9ZZZZ
MTLPDRKIIELYLRAWNTQESIAEDLGVTQKTISNILSKISIDGKITKDFKPCETDRYKLS